MRGIRPLKTRYQAGFVRLSLEIHRIIILDIVLSNKARFHIILIDLKWVISRYYISSTFFWFNFLMNLDLKRPSQYTCENVHIPLQTSTWMNEINLTWETFGKTRVLIDSSWKETQLFLVIFKHRVVPNYQMVEKP